MHPGWFVPSFSCAPLPLPPISSASAQLITEIMEAATSWQSSGGRGKERRVPCASWTPSPLSLLHPLQLHACCSFNGSRRTFSYFPSFLHSPELQEDLLGVGDGGKPARVALAWCSLPAASGSGMQGWGGGAHRSPFPGAALGPGEV